MAEPKKLGRPTKYTEALADEICLSLATGTKGLSLLCKENDHWPSLKTVNTWLFKNKIFLQRYLEAKERQIELQIDEIDDLTSSNEGDFYFDQDGKMCPNTPYLHRLKLKINARMWHAGKLKPKKYGDKAHQDTNDKMDEIKEQLTEVKGIVNKCMKPL